MLDCNNDAIRLAESISAAISTENIGKLVAHEDDIVNPEYLEIKEGLRRFVALNPKVVFAYLYVLIDDKVFFLVDSEAPNSEDYSPPGQEYPEATYATKKPFFDGKSLLSGPETDRWGTWISVFVPIKKEGTNAVMAVLGLDYDARDWHLGTIIHLVKSVAIASSIMALIIAYYGSRVKNKELNMANEKLHESEQLFKAIFNQAPIGIAIATSSKTVIDINRIYLNIIGRDMDEL
ncbi:MAG: hypothetical protein Q8N36_05790, partial [bacterium]|nr:hypothetical protein [bacterium]